MNLEEYLLRILIALQPMVPSMVAVVLVTCFVLPVALYLAKGLWVDQVNFTWFGIFYGLQWKDCVRLSSCWIKMIVMIVFVVQFQKLTLIHYVCFLAVGVLYALDFKAPLRTVGHLFWVAVEVIAVATVNIICGYILDVNAGLVFILMYVLLGMFVALFAVYSFITEVNEISSGRRANLEKIRASQK